MNAVTDKHEAAVRELFAPYDLAVPGDAALILAKCVPDYTEAVRKLRAACKEAMSFFMFNVSTGDERAAYERVMCGIVCAALEETKEFAE